MRIKYNDEQRHIRGFARAFKYRPWKLILRSQRIHFASCAVLLAIEWLAYLFMRKFNDDFQRR